MGGSKYSYFGDGVGAAALGKVPKGYGVLACETFTNSRVYEAVRLRGGGSNLPGLSNLISKHFCAPVRIAKPYMESSKFQDILNNQIYSTLIGTLRLANENTASNSFNLNQSENLQFSKNIFSKLLS